MTKVVIVDDDQDTVEVFCEYLGIKNIEVLGRGFNGKQAVELYQKFKPEVILLDVMMPDYDGFYALRNIRELDPEAKIIMVTADMTQETERKLHELQASAILYKPYEIDNVVETIDKVKRGEVLLEKSLHSES